MQQMILHHVAHRTHFLVERAAALDAEGLRHGDLHVLHMVAIPDRLEEPVRETEVEQILHRFLAEVVIDAKNGFLGEYAEERGVERLGASPDRGRRASRR